MSTPNPVAQSKALLAKKLRRFLFEKNKRPAWLSERTGVSNSNISQILNKKGNPTLETLTRLEQELDEPLLNLKEDQ